MTDSSAGTVRARLLLTGDELLRGFIQDANAGYLATQLRELGIELEQVRIVGDDHGVIHAALVEALAQVDLVVITGGLGPTHDDRTSEAVARAAGVELELREDALEVVESRVRAYGRMKTPEEVEAFTPGNRKQATMPEGATWVDPLGTAPGYALSVDADARVVAVLPGPPPELRHAWAGIERTDELRALRERVGPRHERLVRVWGVPESQASQALAQLGHEDDDARRVTLCARDGELELSLRGTDAAAIDELASALADRFADATFAIDDERGVVELVADQLRRRAWTLGLAESCTGGMLGAAATSVAGSSEWFLGSLVTYANEAKVAVARVDPALLAAHGAVSEEVARELARGAREVLGADVGVGITGIAGPGGGTPDKPVGTVHMAVALPDGEHHRRMRIPGNRETVRRRSVSIALHELRIALGEMPVAAVDS